VPARVIDGNALAEELKDRLRAEGKGLAEQGVQAGLATMLVGDDYASHVYERRVRRLAESVGCHYVCERLPADAEQADALAVVGKLNADPRISGILILRPLPAQVSEVELYRILDPIKDIEAVHPLNAGLLALGRPRFIPSTPASCFYLLDRYLQLSGRDPGSFYRGSDLVVVGRSNNVGKPALLLALARNATLISCDEYTFAAGRLPEHTRQADALIVAAGVPGLIGPDHVHDGVIVIDVGINPVTDPGSGKVRLVGDVQSAPVAEKAEALSPVPGGVGPVTDVWLLRNTVVAARLAAGMDQPDLDPATLG
jgi:methylenetetrahydrofolate dehydrogenase (NADP+)/methenyltetrahydrofolate cyclohydrolase